MLRPWQRIGMAVMVALVLGGASAWTALAAVNSPGAGAGAGAPATAPAAAKVPRRDAQKKNPIPADAGSRATGQKVYSGNCAPCHGASGQGDGPIAHLQDTPPANLTDARYATETDGALFWRISNGHRPMPHFENILPDESRWNVVNYLRTLITVATTAPSTRPAPPRTP